MLNIKTCPVPSFCASTPMAHKPRAIAPGALSISRTASPFFCQQHLRPSRTNWRRRIYLQRLRKRDPHSALRSAQPAAFCKVRDVLNLRGTVNTERAGCVIFARHSEYRARSQQHSGKSEIVVYFRGNVNTERLFQNCWNKAKSSLVHRERDTQTDRHTHTHIYIYIDIYICVYISTYKSIYLSIHLSTHKADLLEQGDEFLREFVHWGADKQTPKAQQPSIDARPKLKRHKYPPHQSRVPPFTRGHALAASGHVDAHTCVPSLPFNPLTERGHNGKALTQNKNSQNQYPGIFTIQNSLKRELLRI